MEILERLPRLQGGGIDHDLQEVYADCAGEWILPPIAGEAPSHRIVRHVADVSTEVFFDPNDVIVKVLLPLKLGPMLGKPVSRFLLEVNRGLPGVGSFMGA